MINSKFPSLPKVPAELPGEVEIIDYLTRLRSRMVDELAIVRKALDRADANSQTVAEDYNPDEIVQFSLPKQRIESSGYKVTDFAPSDHHVLSATHGDTTAADVVRGDLITGQGATPAWARLAKGAAGTILNMGADEPQWSTQAALLGSGTNNYIPKFLVGATPTFTNSIMSDSGTVVSLDGNLTLTADAAAENRTLNIQGWDGDSAQSWNFKADTDGSLTIKRGTTIEQIINPTKGTFVLGDNAGTGGSGQRNTFIGSNAGGYSSWAGDANRCTLIGFYAGLACAGVNAWYNTFIGHEAGKWNAGNANTFIGHASGSSAAVTGSNSVFIGALSGYYETGSNKLFIDNTSRANEADARIKAMMYGVFNAAPTSQYLTVNGNLINQMYSADTNAVRNLFTLKHDTSGTAANGLGGAIVGQLQSSTTADQDAAKIAWRWRDATHAYRTSEIVFSTVYGAAAIAETQMFTPSGGFAIKLTAGEDLVRGNGAYINPAGAASNVYKTPVDGDMCIGVVYADATSGNPVWVVVTGKAYVLPTSTVSFALGDVIYSSTSEAGRADSAATVPAITTHMREWGHALAASGSNGALTLCVLHFN